MGESTLHLRVQSVAHHRLLRVTIAVLYHVGIMKWASALSGALQRVLGTSKAESMSATANIFVGQTEVPLVVKPYIASMTQSELFAVMVVVTRRVPPWDAMIGVLRLPHCGVLHVGPGGLLFAKMLMPETEEPKAELPDQADDEAPVNVIDAAAGGASSGLQLALNVGAMLLAFVALIALLNGVLGGIGAWVGRPDLTLELMLGWAFSPLAFLLGVPWSEAVTRSFIGQKLVVNEFVAYLNLRLTWWRAQGGRCRPRPRHCVVCIVRIRQPELHRHFVGRLGRHGAFSSERHRQVWPARGDGRHHVQPDVGHYRRPVRRAR